MSVFRQRQFRFSFRYLTEAAPPRWSAVAHWSTINRVFG